MNMSHVQSMYIENLGNNMSIKVTSNLRKYEMTNNSPNGAQSHQESLLSSSMCVPGGGINPLQF